MKRAACPLHPLRETKAGGLNRATMAVGFPTVQALHACCCGVVRGIYRQRQHSTHAVCRHIRRASEFA